MSHKLDDKVKSRTVDVTESTDIRSFSDLHLGRDLTKGLNNAGFFKPSPVQWAALPMSSLGVDLGMCLALAFIILYLIIVMLSKSSLPSCSSKIWNWQNSSICGECPQNGENGGKFCSDSVDCTNP